MFTDFVLGYSIPSELFWEGISIFFFWGGGGIPPAGVAYSAPPDP